MMSAITLIFSYFVLHCLIVTAVPISSDNLPPVNTSDSFHTPVSSESAYHRDYFYVGGRYADDGTGTGEHIFKDQMYVERLTPADGKIRRPYPIILIHGQAQTGTNWLNTPDGRKGWASWLIDQGYDIYILDQTSRARSAWSPMSTPQATYSAELIEKRFTAPETYMLWPQASLHTQWPGNGTMGDAIFDAYYASNVQFVNSTIQQQKAMQAAGSALLDRIGPAILLAHSQGGLYPWLMADARPDLVKAIVSIEPMGPPFRDVVFSSSPARPYGLTDVPLTYSPAVTNTTKPLQAQVIPSSAANRSSCTLQAKPARRLVNLASIPVLVETGEASYHAVYDDCTVQFLRQAGVDTDFIQLADVGIHGNGHLQFLEKNNLEIVSLLEKWMREKLGY